MLGPGYCKLGRALRSLRTPASVTSVPQSQTVVSCFESCNLLRPRSVMPSFLTRQFCMATIFYANLRQ